MLTSLPYHDQTARVPQDDQFTVRLRGLSPQQLLDALTLVAFWSPGTFTAALDYCEATGWGWPRSDPDQATGPDGDGNPDDPAPVCAQCRGKEQEVPGRCADHGIKSDHLFGQHEWRW